MRMLATATVIGPLLLIGALPAAAGQSTLTPITGATIQLADAGGKTADQDTYTHEAKVEMRAWRRKLRDFGVTTKADGTEVRDATDKDLKVAWSKAKIASRNLQAASAEGWESAKVTYDQASRDLADAWHKVRPDDK
jgi:hypothetical protein